VCQAGDTNAACGNNAIPCQPCTGFTKCSFSAGFCE
jgi:hypothetical protein